MNISALHAAVVAVCPIEGISSDGRIDFAPGATQTQMDAANKVVSSWVDPPAVREMSKKRLIQAMDNAGLLPAFGTALVAQTSRNQLRWQSYDTIPENNPLLVRICAAASPAIVVSPLYDGG